MLSFILFLYLAVAQYAMSRIWVDDDDGKESLFKVTCLLVFQWVSPKVGLTMAKGLTVAKCGCVGPMVLKVGLIVEKSRIKKSNG